MYRHAKMAESFYRQSMKIAAVVTAYWFISISMVFLNKYLLSSDDLKLDAPFFITWFQCVVTVILCILMSFISKFFPDFMQFPTFEIDLKLLYSCLPLSIVFVAMMSFNNLCLKYVDVAFYYIGRSLTTVFNVLFTYLILQQTTSLKAIICCTIIIFGFFGGVDQEAASGSFSVIGVVFGVLASASVALNAIFTKKVLPSLDNNIWKLTFYNNINASLLFLPFMFFFQEFKEVYHFPKLWNLNFWSFMVLSGFLGFGIGFVTGLQIKVTSPLTHNISGTAKACAQTIIACFYFKDVKPVMWWMSNAIILGGSGAYTEVRRQEMKQKHIEDKKLSIEVAPDPTVVKS